MKPLSFALLLALTLCARAADIVRIPDGRLLAALISHGVDANNNGQITTAEAAKIENLALKQAGISDATGLEAFTNLRVLDLEGNQIGSLNTRPLPHLERLNVRQNQIRVLDIKGNKKLIRLDARENLLTALDIRGLAALEMVSLVQNLELSQFIHGDNPSLLRLYLSYTKVAAIDLRAYQKMTLFEAFNSDLAELHLGEKPELEGLSLTSTPIAALDLSRCPKLRVVLAGGCPNLQSINTAGAIALEEVQLAHSGIGTADFTGSPLLKKIDLRSTPLTELHIRGLSRLEWLDCSDKYPTGPRLKQLNFAGCFNLRFLQL
jgi:Leucine-rich repeat (LRR) protein